MKTSPVAKAFTISHDALAAYLASCNDATLELISQWAKGISEGRGARVTNHTPRGHVIASAAGERVLSAVRIEESKRAGI